MEKSEKYYVDIPTYLELYSALSKGIDIFLISPQKLMLWLLITSASLKHF